MGPLLFPRVDLGTEPVEGQGSHLPPLHRCLHPLAAAGQVAGRVEALLFLTTCETQPLLKSRELCSADRAAPGQQQLQEPRGRLFAALCRLPCRAFTVLASTEGRFSRTRLCCIGCAALTFRQLVGETGEALAYWDGAALPLGFSSVVSRALWRHAQHPLPSGNDIPVSPFRLAGCWRGEPGHCEGQGRPCHRGARAPPADAGGQRASCSLLQHATATCSSGRCPAGVCRVSLKSHRPAEVKRN